MSALTEVALQPLPAEVLAFLVGRDAEGHWLAVEAHGRAGGFFRDERAALRYSADETDHRPGAVQLCQEPLALVLDGRPRRAAAA
jgi:hypothetical protein